MNVFEDYGSTKCGVIRYHGAKYFLPQHYDMTIKEKKNMRGKVLKNMIPYLGLIIVVVFFAVITGGKTLRWNNLNLIIGQLFTTVISAAGVVFVMSMGSLDFSQGSVLAVCCYTAAKLSGVSVAASILGAVICGALLGLLNGILVAELKIRSFVATICTMFILRGLIRYLTARHSITVSMDMLHLNVFTVKLILCVLILAAAFFLYRYTGFGRNARMIGAGETAVEYAGVNVKRTKILVFMLAGMLAGTAAVFSLTRTGSVISTTGNLLETDVMIALVLGGLPVTGGAKSRFAPVLTGALLLTCLDNGLVQMGAGTVMQQLVKGIFFLLAIIVTMDRKAAVVNK